jgi:hypothetical protein
MFVSVVIEHHSCRIRVPGATAHPCAAAPHPASPT